MSRAIQRFRTSTILFLVALFVTCVSSLVQAQPWTSVYTAPNPINCITFLDDLGQPLKGFLGQATSISYTTDGGTTWTASTTPTITGVVTNFAFKDPLNGWCSILNNGSDNGILRTTDGGVTWHKVIPAPKEGNSVYYHAGTGRLYLLSATDSAAYSPDDGATWINFAGIGYTGMAFSNSATGVIVSAGSAFPNSYWLRTVDGGRTWIEVLVAMDSWQPIGLPTTKRFFASDPITQDMYTSTDGGASWLTLIGWAGKGSFPTGAMAGDPCSIFASSQSQMWSSTDDGSTWAPIPLGPTMSPSTRFYVSPTKVFAFAGKQLSSHDRPVAQPLHLYPSALTYASGGCTATDTVIRLFGCNCTNIRIMDAAIENSTAFTLTKGTTPRTFCGADSFHVSYKPVSAIRDTGLLRITFDRNGTTVDTVIPLYGPGMPISVTLNTNSYYIKNVPGCREIDTSIYLSNTLCNTLTLEQAYVDDPQHIQVLPPSLPYTINALETLRLPIHASGVKQGTYVTVLHIVVSTNGGGSVTKDVPITLTVSKSAVPDIRGLNWSIKNICSLHDTAVYYINTLCDSIQVDGAILRSTVDFRTTGLSLPAKLGPGDVLRIPIHIIPTKPGTYSTTLRLTGIIQDVTLDTVIPISLTIREGITLAAQATPFGATFGTTSTCDSTRTITIKFTNTSCLPLTVGTNYAARADSAYTFPSHFNSGRVLQPGEQDSIIVHFWPRRQQTNGETGSIQVTYSYNGETNTVTLPLSGSGSDKVSAALGDLALAFDSLNFCETKQLSTTLTNGPCSDIVISDLNMLAGQGFTIVAPKKGDVIPPGGSIPVTVVYTPQTSGDVLGKVEINITDRSGNIGVSDTLNFTSFVRPPIRSYTMSSIRPDSLLACMTRDTLLTLVNNGFCDTIKIASITPSTSTVTIGAATTSQLPAVVAPGQSFSIVVHIDPNNVVADINGQIHLTGTLDTNLSYFIPVGTCGVAPPSILSYVIPDSVFNTANCTPLTREFDISITNNETNITGVTLGTTPASKFALSLLGGASIPYNLKKGDVLRIQITYDPDAAGADATTLTVATDTKGTRTIPLSGSATGAPVQATLGLVGPASTAPVPFSATYSITPVLRQNVNTALGLSTAKFVVKYDRDVMTLKTITPSAGWSLGTRGGSIGADDITLQYTGSGTISANSPVATLTFAPSLSKNTGTDITVEQTHFNSSDPNFERCKLSLATAGEVLHVDVQPSCSDSILLRYMRGEQPITEFSIIPNPVHPSQQASRVAFRTTHDGVLRVDVVDVMGTTVSTLAFGQTAAGEKQYELDARSLSEGTYFVRISVDGLQTTKRFVVQSH